MDRRQFLIRTGLIGCSAAASPLVTPVVLADAPWDNRLVVIILRGAMDGLDVVRPVGDPDYAGLRARLDRGDGLPLDDFWQLHPALAAVAPLYQREELGFYHATSTPYRDKRSHFDGQDILEAGYGVSGAVNARDGWLNRLLQVSPGVTRQTAYAIGREQMQILDGPAPATRWSPDASLDLTPQAQRLLELVYHDDPIFRDAADSAMTIAAQLSRAEETGADDGAAMDGMMMDDPSMASAVREGDHTEIARFAARRLRDRTRIASFSLNGWDTHVNQQNNIARRLEQLGDVILTLRAGLGPVWDRTAVLCMTEFGRTARENGTRGTDHGTGGALVYAGGALRGGRVMGRWPGLAPADLYQERDLMPMRDVRGIAGWAMRGLFGVNRDAIEGTIFPGLDLDTDPGLLW